MRNQIRSAINKVPLIATPKLRQRLKQGLFLQVVHDLQDSLGSCGSEYVETKVTDSTWFCYTAYCFQ